MEKPIIEQQPTQVSQEGFVPAVPTIENPEIKEKTIESSPVTTSKATLIRPSEQFVANSSDTEVSSTPSKTWAGYGYAPAVDSDGNETRGDYMSSLVLAKENGEPAVE